MALVKRDSKRVKECKTQGHGYIMKIGGGDCRYMCTRCGIMLPKKEIEVKRGE